MNGERIPFNTSFGGEVCHVLKGGDIFGTAIGITAVINGVDTDKDIADVERFGHCKRKRKKNRIASGDISDRNTIRHFALVSIFGHLDIVG